MRRSIAALLVGVLLGVSGTFTTVEMIGGWYTYVLMGKSECETGRQNIGHMEIAPNQPNPCLLRIPRFH